MAAKVTKEELRQIATLSKLFIPEEEEENLQENIDIIENAGGYVNESSGTFWVP